MSALRLGIARARPLLEHAFVRRIVVALALLLAFVILPFLIWGDAFELSVVERLQRTASPVTAALVVGGLMAADVLLPVPSSIVAVAAGIVLGAPLGAAALALGSTIGCLAGYALGRLVDQAGLRRWLGDDEHRRMTRFFARYGRATVLMLRATPVLAEASVIAAGAARMPPWSFAASCVAGNVVVAVVYASIGDWSAATGRHELAIAAGLVLPGLAMAAAAWRETSLASKEARSSTLP